MQTPNLIQKLFGAKNGAKSLSTDIRGESLFGWQPTSGTYHAYKHNEYENAYGSIRPIASRFSSIAPYAINAKGEKLAQAQAVDALYRPNKDMGSTQFREAIAVMAHVHREVNILVWRREGNQVFPGGDITPQNIGGYTFIENCSKVRINGTTRFEVTNEKGQRATFTDKEVITLKYGIDPYDLSTGMSPTQAAKRWTRLDDYISDYQAGFFENGAVPSGMFRIVAKTAQEFNDIVSNMQAKHRGAGNNNNITYSHTPIDPETGKPATASKIEWIPFNISNNDLDLGTIFDNVNKKIDSSYGVPATIRSVNESVTYASAQVDERNFVINTLKPFTNNIWSQFTHELNRITGGLGFAIVFDLEVPALSDANKTDAETRSLDVTTLISLEVQGYTTDSIKRYISTGDITELEKEAVEEDTEEEDRADVDEGGEVNNSPDPEDVTKGLKALSPEQRATYETKLEQVARRFMEQQVDNAVRTTKVITEPTDDQEQEFVNEAMQVITALMVVEGALEYQKGVQLLIEAGLSAPDAATFILSATQRAEYAQYLRGVAKSYAADTTTAIRQVLDIAQESGWTNQQTQTRLRQIPTLENWRAKRLAVTETHRSLGKSSVYAIQSIEEQTDIKFDKIWTSNNPDRCEFCASLVGRSVGVGDNFVDLHDAIHGIDGGIYINDFTPIDTAQAHPNCKCFLTYKVLG